MDAIKKPYRLLIVFLLISTAVFCDEEEDGKEAEIECVNSCGDNVEEWKKCAQNCYGDYMDDSDKTFLACETSCVDKLYKPDSEDQSELEACATKCIDEYRGEVDSKIV